ncbi:MAG: hypothetical protein J6562_05295, partial [Candidatus Schmidhempelia sp.]|nr:hypothetical protein [Candidatus Schmidhempelia sp.]
AKDFINGLKHLQEKEKLDALRRVSQRINEIMYFAVNSGIIDANPAGKIRYAFATATSKNMLTIDVKELSAFRFSRRRGG